MGSYLSREMKIVQDTTSMKCGCVILLSSRMKNACESDTRHNTLINSKHSVRHRARFSISTDSSKENIFKYQAIRYISGVIDFEFFSEVALPFYASSYYGLSLCFIAM